MESWGAEYKALTSAGGSPLVGHSPRGPLHLTCEGDLRAGSEIIHTVTVKVRRRCVGIYGDFQVCGERVVNKDDCSSNNSNIVTVRAIIKGFSYNRLANVSCK